MKKRLLSLVVLLIVSSYNLKAQNLIAVQHSGSNTAFYTSLDDAVTNAQNGDTIYLPGGAFAVNGDALTINKELHILGVGYNTDSTFATGVTKINARITFVSGANNSTINGIYLNGVIWCGTDSYNEDVDNIIISRCHINQSIYISRLSNNWSLTENIIDGTINGYSSSSGGISAQSNYFSNNIINSAIYNFGSNNQFLNNIIKNNAYYSLNNVTGCVFENNIWLNSNLVNYSSCIFNNNLCIGSINITVDCLGSNNIMGQASSLIFINNISGGFGFLYSDNYQLQSTSPGKNAGTDGTDIGIYGGAFPWKEGSVPHNPHIINKTIGSTTNSNGALPVKITVGAQER